MAMQDAGPLQTHADAGGISGGSKNVCIRTSLIRSGGHQSRRQPPQSRRVM